MFERKNAKETLNPFIKFGIIAGLSAAALTGCATANAEGPVSTPSSTSSEAPSPTASEAPTGNETETGREMPDPHDFDFPADATPEQLAEIYGKFETAMYVGNMTQENTSDRFDTEWAAAQAKDSSADMNEFAKSFIHEVSNEWLTELFDAQMVPNYQSIPDLSDMYGNREDSNETNVQNYLTAPNLLDASITTSNIQVVTQTDHQIVMHLDLTYHYHGTAKDSANNAKLDGVVDRVSVTFQKNGDRYLIADYGLVKE